MASIVLGTGSKTENLYTKGSTEICFVDDNYRDNYQSLLQYVHNDTGIHLCQTTAINLVEVLIFIIDRLYCHPQPGNTIFLLLCYRQLCVILSIVFISFCDYRLVLHFGLRFFFYNIIFIPFFVIDFVKLYSWGKTAVKCCVCSHYHTCYVYVSLSYCFLSVICNLYSTEFVCKRQIFISFHSILFRFLWCYDYSLKIINFLFELMCVCVFKLFAYVFQQHSIGFNFYVFLCNII